MKCKKCGKELSGRSLYDESGRYNNIPRCSLCHEKEPTKRRYKRKKPVIKKIKIGDNWVVDDINGIQYEEQPKSIEELEAEKKEEEKKVIENGLDD